MALTLTAAVANAMLDAGIGTPANSGLLRVYDGSRPATPSTAVSTQVKLLEFNMPADAFPAAASGVLTANAIAAAVGLAVGTASWFRLLQSNGTTALIDGSVTESGGGGDCIIDEADITIGGSSAISSLVLTQPLG